MLKLYYSLNTFLGPGVICHFFFYDVRKRTISFFHLMLQKMGLLQQLVFLLSQPFAYYAADVFVDRNRVTRTHPWGFRFFRYVDHPRHAHLENKLRIGIGRNPIPGWSRTIMPGRGCIACVLDYKPLIVYNYKPILLCNGRSTPVAQSAPRNLLTRWDVSSIPANGIFLTKN